MDKCDFIFLTLTSDGTKVGKRLRRGQRKVVDYSLPFINFVVICYGMDEDKKKLHTLQKK